MSDFPKDIFTEPANIDVDTLANLGPLRGMAGIWEGIKGLDIKPKAFLLRGHRVDHSGGQKEPFHHTDRNTLTRVAEPTPNPLAGGG